MTDPEPDLVRLTCDRCGVYWDGDYTDIVKALHILAVHRADSCHPISA
jgi:hypothetical protein